MRSAAHVRVERFNASRSNVDPNYIGRSIETICDDQNVRRVDAKGHLFVEGDPKSHVYKIASGAICLYRIQLDGRRQIIEFAFEGDLIGIGSAAVQSCNAQALVSTPLKYLSLSTLANAARRDVKIALGLYEALSCEQIRSREHLSYLGRRGATERLAAFLVGLSRRNHETGRNPRILWLPMTRVDIADYLGLTIETVSRTFTKLKKRGLITIRSHKMIILSNFGELELLCR